MLTKSQRKFIDSVAKGAHEPVNSGHMLYIRSLVHHPAEPWFYKAHDSSLFSLEKKRSESLRYLQKEASVYKHLREKGYQHIPDKHHFNDGVLLLSGLRTQDGWHWRAPGGDMNAEYINSTLRALGKLQAIPTHSMFDTESSVDFFWDTGWGSDRSLIDAINIQIAGQSEHLRSQTHHSLQKLASSLDEIRLHKKPEIGTHISHHDIRQSNLAWHQSHGTVIVDWSWASHGVKDADTTMFLIDLHKSGVDVSPWLLRYFNPEYAKLMIGWWLLRAGEPSAQGNDIVRLQMLISAASAFELLQV